MLYSAANQNASSRSSLKALPSSSSTRHLYILHHLSICHWTSTWLQSFITDTDEPIIRTPPPLSFPAPTFPSLLVRQSVALYKTNKSDAFNDLCCNSPIKKYCLCCYITGCQFFCISLCKTLVQNMTTIEVWYGKPFVVNHARSGVPSGARLYHVYHLAV